MGRPPRWSEWNGEESKMNDTKIEIPQTVETARRDHGYDPSSTLEQRLEASGLPAGTTGDLHVLHRVTITSVNYDDANTMKLLGKEGWIARCDAHDPNLTFLVGANIDEYGQPPSSGMVFDRKKELGIEDDDSNGWVWVHAVEAVVGGVVEVPEGKGEETGDALIDAANQQETDSHDVAALKAEHAV